MKKHAAYILLGAFITAPAMAADLPARAPVRAPVPVAVAIYSWSGCYIGVHGGGAFGNKRFYDAATGAEFTVAEHDIDGWLVGGQVGCNIQSGRWVFGIEGQAAWSDVAGSVSGTAAAPIVGPVTGTLHTEADILGSIAGRIGMAFDRALIFAKGGAAFIHERHWVIAGGAEIFGSEKQLRWGWMVGGGLEYAFSPNWSGKIEYNFNHFGDQDVEFCAVPAGVCGDVQVRQVVHVVKAGINYRFGGGGGGVVARY